MLLQCFQDLCIWVDFCLLECFFVLLLNIHYKNGRIQKSLKIGGSSSPFLFFAENVGTSMGFEKLKKDQIVLGFPLLVIVKVGNQARNKKSLQS